MTKQVSRHLGLIFAILLLNGCNNSKPTTPASDVQPAAVAVPAMPVEKPKDPPQLKPVHRFKSGIRELSRVLITDDGTQIAASGDSVAKPQQIEIWALKPEPKSLREIPGVLHAFSPDGKLLIRGGTKWHDVEVVETETGKLRCKIEEESDFQAFASADKIVTVCITSQISDRPGSLRIRTYHARTGRIDLDFTIPSTSHPTIAGPVNGRRELFFVWEGRIEVCDLVTGKMIRKLVPETPTFKRNDSDFALTNDGKRMIAQWDKSPQTAVYDTVTGALVAPLKSDLSTGYTFLADGTRLLRCSSWVTQDGSFKKGLRTHDLAQREIVADFPEGYLSPAISANGKVMVTMVDRVNPELLVFDLTRLP